MYKTWDNVSQSLKIAWKYKILWIFALVIAGGTFQFNNSGNGEDSGDDYDFNNKEQIEGVSNFISADVLGSNTNSISEVIIDGLPVNLGIVFSAFITALIFSISLTIAIRTWATGALIKGTDVAIKGAEINIKELSDNGRISFRRLFKLEVIILILIISLSLLLLVPALIFLVSGNYVVGAVFGLAFFVVSLVLGILLLVSSPYVIRFIVLKGYAPIQAIKSGLKTYKENVGKTVSLFFANCLVQSLLMGVVFSLLATIFYFFIKSELKNSLLQNPSLFGIVVALGVPILFAAYVMLSAFSGYLATYNNISWTTLFNHLEGSKEDAIK